MYKILNDMVQVPAQYHPKPHHTDSQIETRSHSQQLRRPNAEVNAFKYAFLPRIIADWNSLSPDVVAAESLELLKTRLTAHLQ